MSRKLFDLKSFSSALKRKRKEMRLTIRQAAILSKMNFSTFSRIERGSMPEVLSYVKGCRWLGVSTESFLDQSHKKPEEFKSLKLSELMADMGS
jgi:transcriptional regulator with XRE-family HTH domain